MRSNVIWGTQCQTHTLNDTCTTATAHTANNPTNCLHCVKTALLRKGDCDLADHRTWTRVVLIRRPREYIKSKATPLALKTIVTSVSIYKCTFYCVPDHGNFIAQKAFIRWDILWQLHGKRDTCTYDLSFVGHDPASMSIWIPMVRRLMGANTYFRNDADQVYPLTQLHLPN